MHMDINLDLYKYFYETAKAGNVTKAAGKLFVSQSAVSQAIVQLEEKLGCKLFIRSTRGVRLTTEGAAILPLAENALTLLDNAHAKIANMKTLKEGEIKIGASETACSLYLLRRLEKFGMEYPDIHISVINRTSRELISLLKNGTVDMSFVSLPLEPDESLEISPIMEIRDCFVAGARYASLAESVISLGELLKYPVLMLDTSSNSRQYMDAFLLSRNIVIKPSVELGSMTLLAEFAKIGIGIAATIKESVPDMLDRRELYELRLIEAPPPRSIALAQIRNASHSFAADAFLSAIFH